MAKKKSFAGSFVSTAAAAAVAASVGYLVYKTVSSKSSVPSKGRKKDSAKSSLSGRAVKGSRPKGSISRRKEPPAPNTKGKDAAKKDRPQPKVEWIPNLRVREKKILNVIPSGKDVSMSDVQKHFPDVTVRTIRRDMERLVQKGRVSKSGTTRATTYRKV
jgi:hypothetical protein